MYYFRNNINRLFLSEKKQKEENACYLGWKNALSLQAEHFYFGNYLNAYQLPRSKTNCQTICNHGKSRLWPLAIGAEHLSQSQQVRTSNAMTQHQAKFIQSFWPIDKPSLIIVQFVR